MKGLQYVTSCNQIIILHRTDDLTDELGRVDQVRIACEVCGTGIQCEEGHNSLYDFQHKMMPEKYYHTAIKHMSATDFIIHTKIHLFKMQLHWLVLLWNTMSKLWYRIMKKAQPTYENNFLMNMHFSIFWTENLQKKELFLLSQVISKLLTWNASFYQTCVLPCPWQPHAFHFQWMRSVRWNKILSLSAFSLVKLHSLHWMSSIGSIWDTSDSIIHSLNEQLRMI